MTLITKVCSNCGSRNITHDALVRWSEEEQKWELSSMLDSGDCDDCGYDGNSLVMDRALITTEDVGLAITKSLALNGLEHIDDSDDNNLRVITTAGVFTIRIIRES